MSLLAVFPHSLCFRPAGADLGDRADRVCRRGHVGLHADARSAQARGRARALRDVTKAGPVLLLFADKSRTDLKVLRNIRALPGRLLTVGMLLTLLLGAAAALTLMNLESADDAEGHRFYPALTGAE